MADISSIISKYIELKPNGREFIGICPFHNDTSPSLKVNNEKNLYKCFSCGHGGSAAHFVYEYCKLKNIKPLEIVKDDHLFKKQEHKLEEWKPIFPVLCYYEQPTFRHVNHGLASQVWKYVDEKGNTLFYVCRFNLKDGKKEVLPYVYATNGKVQRWSWRGLPKDRPLYNLNSVVKSTKPICIVEGEKCADWGNRYSQEFTFTSIQGGSNAYKLTNYSQLYGKHVVLINDNDVAGMKCMDEIYKIIKPLCKSVHRVKELKDYPPKWDIADQTWAKGELDLFIRKHIER